MDGRQLRRGRAGPNFRPCVDLWWHTVEQAGEDRVEDNEVNLVLAECYPLINTARALQNIYVDAHLLEGLRLLQAGQIDVIPLQGIERQQGHATHGWRHRSLLVIVGRNKRLADRLVPVLVDGPTAGKTQHQDHTHSQDGEGGDSVFRVGGLRGFGSGVRATTLG